MSTQIKYFILQTLFLRLQWQFFLHSLTQACTFYTSATTNVNNTPQNDVWSSSSSSSWIFPAAQWPDCDRIPLLRTYICTESTLENEAALDETLSPNSTHSKGNNKDSAFQNRKTTSALLWREIPVHSAQSGDAETQLGGFTHSTSRCTIYARLLFFSFYVSHL